MPFYIKFINLLQTCLIHIRIRPWLVKVGFGCMWWPAGTTTIRVMCSHVVHRVADGDVVEWISLHCGVWRWCLHASKVVLFLGSARLWLRCVADIGVWLVLEISQRLVTTVECLMGKHQLCSLWTFIWYIIVMWTYTQNAYEITWAG